jgi:bacillithiol system protein YtxJ
MAAKFVKIQSSGQLAELFERSSREPVALVKHSNSCGTSYDILEQLGVVDGEVNIVVVQEHRDLSDEIALRTGYRHQSPQAFVLVDGKPIYHATHYGIDSASIERSLKGQG